MVFFFTSNRTKSLSRSRIKRDWVCPNQSRVFIREYVFIILYSLERAELTVFSKTSR